MPYGHGVAFEGISIHTPARGVTGSYMFNPVEYLISIHTPARGVTGAVLYGATDFMNFNPHSRTGSDLIYALTFDDHREFQSTLPHGE